MRIFPDGTVAGEVEEGEVVPVCLPAEADEEPEEAGGRVSMVPLEALVEEETFPSLPAEEGEEGEARRMKKKESRFPLLGEKKFSYRRQGIKGRRDRPVWSAERRVVSWEESPFL